MPFLKFLLQLLLLICVLKSNAEYFEIVNRHSGKCMEAYGLNKVDNGLVDTWGCWSGRNQAWTLDCRKEICQIVNVGSRLCLTIFQSKPGKNTPWINQYTCHYFGTQKWKIVLTERDSRYYYFENVETGMCLSVYKYNMVDGTPTVLSKCDVHYANQWEIRKIDKI